MKQKINKNEINQIVENIEEEILIEVLEENTKERIDTFLSKRIDITRTRIQELIKNNFILVNEKKTKSSYKIELNDKIIVKIPRVKEVEILPENIEIDIIYEDEDIAIINKKAGLVVHPAHGNSNGTLVNALLYHIKDLSGINGEVRPGIVHRLDKDTSGVIIIAKNDKSHTKLVEMFQKKEIKKTYLAILKGKLNKENGRIETKIGRDKEDRKKMSVLVGLDSVNGKNAITNYKVISKNELFTLVEVDIETGRTHQIRVHMKYLGYPILGDSVYGRNNGNVKRQMLHAYKIEFIHPIKNKEISFIAKIPKDFEETLKNCKLEF